MTSQPVEVTCEGSFYTTVAWKEVPFFNSSGSGGTLTFLLPLLLLLQIPLGNTDHGKSGGTSFPAVRVPIQNRSLLFLPCSHTFKRKKDGLRTPSGSALTHSPSFYWVPGKWQARRQAPRAPGWRGQAEKPGSPGRRCAVSLGHGRGTRSHTPPLTAFLRVAG